MAGREPERAAERPALAASPAPDAAQPADPGREIATIGAHSSRPAIAPIVVHGREAAAPPAGATVATRPAAAVDAGPADVTLNFAGADIRDVVAEILGRTLKLNYVIDPDVTGPVTVNVSRPLRRDELLPLLETVLNSHGATMVQNNGTVRVTALPKDGKPAGPGTPAPMPRAGGGQAQAFPLRYVSATEMERVLQRLLPADAVLNADDSKRVLLVQGGPAELQLAQETVRVFDVDQMAGMSLALVPLRHADPSAMAEEMKNIFGAMRKEATGEAIRFMPVPRLKAVMVITRSGRYLDEARGWIARLDRSPGGNEQRVYAYSLQYSKAVELGQKLQGLLPGLDIQFKPPTPAAAPSPAAAPATGAPGAAPITATPVSATAGADVNAVKPPDAKPAEPVPPSALAANAAPDPTANPGAVRIEADEAHNALLISATPRDYELIHKVLEGIDVPPLQVLIEVTVAEVELNDKLKYGVEYFINSGRGNILLTGSNIPAISPSVPGFALSWVSGNFQPRAILDALSDVTETRVISTPRLLVLSNQTARLQVGDVVPIITQSATSTVTSNPLILNNVTYKETGVVLEVTPRVNAGGHVTMDVNQAVSDVVNTTTSTIDSPTIRQRRLTSTISVRSGQSILLGGLIQQQSSRESSGIPVLSEIPGVGALFGSRNNSGVRTELIMLMTPHVISNDDQARDVTARVERQFEAVLDSSNMVRPRRPAR